MEVMAGRLQKQIETKKSPTMNTRLCSRSRRNIRSPKKNKSGLAKTTNQGSKIKVIHPVQQKRHTHE